VEYLRVGLKGTNLSNAKWIEVGNVIFLAREVLRMFCLVCKCYLMLTLLGT
jgi:hypothetical protein